MLYAAQWWASATAVQVSSSYSGRCRSQLSVIEYICHGHHAVIKVTTPRCSCCRMLLRFHVLQLGHHPTAAAGAPELRGRGHQVCRLQPPQRCAEACNACAAVRIRQMHACAQNRLQCVTGSAHNHVRHHIPSNKCCSQPHTVYAAHLPCLWFR
jgi:hypothetical protein